jgi:hypothetical protein
MDNKVGNSIDKLSKQETLLRHPYFKCRRTGTTTAQLTFYFGTDTSKWPAQLAH